MGADGGAWCTVDPVSLLWTSCRVIAEMGEGPLELPQDLERERHIFDCEQAGEPNTIVDLYASGRAAAGLTLDVGVDGLSAVRRVREVMRPLGATDELRVLLADRGNVWGTITFYRLFGTVPFGDVEVDTAAAAAPLIARAARRAMLRSALDRAELDMPPGLILIDRDDAVVDTTPAAEALLSQIDEQQARSSLASVAAAVRRRGAQSLTVLCPDGVIVLHGTGLKNDGQLVSVVVEQPRPLVLAALVVDRLELTPREAQVATSLLRGATRRQIAHGLGIGVDTADELVGRVLAKAGVASRAEFAQLVDRRDYLPRRLAGADPGPYGFFIDEARAAHVPAIGEGPRRADLRTVMATPRSTEEPMQSAREDLLSYAHAGLRAGLFASTTTLGATDWSDADAASQAIERWQTMSRLLALHAHHEDQAIMPLLADQAPDLVARSQADHDHFAALLADIGTAIDDGVDAESGPKLATAVRRFTAEYLDHLEQEETDVLPALWRACTDDELRACRTRFLSISPPGDVVELQLLMLAAIPPAARRAVIAAGRVALPAPAFQKVGAVFAGRLDPDVWSTISDLFENPEAAS